MDKTGASYFLLRVQQRFIALEHLRTRDDDDDDDVEFGDDIDIDTDGGDFQRYSAERIRFEN